MPREMAVFCDETGTHTCDYFGWGSIWCPLDKTYDIDRALDRIMERAGERRELKWTYGGRKNSRRDIVRWFFKTPWVCFQSFLVRKETMNVFSKGTSRSVAFKKLLCTMLTTQMKRFDALPGGPRRFMVYVDEAGDSTRKMTEREFRILSAATQKRTDSDRDYISHYRRIDSRSRRGIQLADLFIGALRARWEGSPRGNKGRTCEVIARHLGWKDLRGLTPPNLKFNVWMHHDSYDASPHIEHRTLRLKHRGGDPQRLFDRLGKSRNAPAGE